MPKEMKVYIFILLVFNIGILKSQNIELVRFERSDNYKKDCNLINNCIESVDLINQSLVFSIYTKKPARDIERSLTYRKNNDTLIVNYYQSNSNEAVLYLATNKKCEVLIFEFKGFSSVPACIIYNQEVSSLCPVTYLSYSIDKDDTINIVNKNGYKEGKWIDFYKTGEILKIKEYKNGQFIKGNLYDKAGNITHIVSVEGVEVSIPVDFYNATHK
jgi:hypothetical protein